jgi:hypothetical protein
MGCAGPAKDHPVLPDGTTFELACPDGALPVSAGGEHVATRHDCRAQQTFDPKVGAALTFATAATVGSGFRIGVANRLAHVNGWAEEQVAALRTGTPASGAKINVLTGLIGEAAANSGYVTDAMLSKPAGAMSKLTDAFAHGGIAPLAQFCCEQAHFHRLQCTFPFVRCENSNPLDVKSEQRFLLDV